MTASCSYAWKARDNSGKIVRGTMNAASAQEVGARLRAEGKFVFSVEEHALRAGVVLDEEQVQRMETARRVRREDVISFCQQISIMLETGVPLAEALDAFVKQTPRAEFRKVLQSLRDDIHSGEPFSVAMARWPRVFPNMMVSLMKASEASGTMSMMLGRIGDYLAKERKTAKQIKGALSYPTFMMAVAVALTGFLMAFVLPRFASIYELRAATLPTPTLFLLGISKFVTTQYMLYLPAMVVAAIGVAIGMRTERGRRACDWLRLNTPVLKVMYRQLYITRAARTMGTLLSAGVSLLDIVDICRGVTNNRYYDDLWDATAKSIREGRQLSEAISASPYITPNVASMIASGERSGRLADVMDKIARFSEEELEAAVKQTTAYIEPAMIMFMGLLVGGVAMALLLPIFSMGKVMAG